MQLKEEYEILLPRGLNVTLMKECKDENGQTQYECKIDMKRPNQFNSLRTGLKCQKHNLLIHK